MMLSDVQWSELEPLVEACRPKAKTPPQDLQRTLSADFVEKLGTGSKQRRERRRPGKILLLNAWNARREWCCAVRKRQIFSRGDLR
jgi:hypothetical protein